MVNKNEFVKEGYKDKMKNKLYGLLREREKDGEWEKYLDTILIELQGYDDNNKTIDYYTLYSKLSLSMLFSNISCLNVFMYTYKS